MSKSRAQMQFLHEMILDRLYKFSKERLQEVGYEECRKFCYEYNEQDSNLKIKATLTFEYPKSLKPESELKKAYKNITANHYQKLAIRTAADLDEPKKLFQNGILGIVGEAGECADLLKKYLFQGHGLDASRIAEDLGDVLWYVAICAKALDLELSDIMEKNIKKLMLRYPEGFDPERC